MKDQIIQGDTLEVLKTFPDECIDMSITSPPYWGLRDYGVEGQLGLEPDFNDFLKKMWAIYNEIKRVLKKDGTCWINFGDTYGGSGGYGGNTDFNSQVSSKNQMINNQMRMGKGQFKNQQPRKIAPKCLLMIPERFALGMIDRGWILRNKIIWNKPNHMPSSVKDRFSNSWEYVYFFSKSKKYYFDLDAVREPHKYSDDKRNDGKRHEYKKGKWAEQSKFGNRGVQFSSSGKNPGDVIKTVGEHLNSPRARTQRNGYYAKNHFYHSLGKPHLTSGQSQPNHSQKPISQYSLRSWWNAQSRPHRGGYATSAESRGLGLLIEN